MTEKWQQQQQQEQQKNTIWNSLINNGLMDTSFTKRVHSLKEKVFVFFFFLIFCCFSLTALDHHTNDGNTKRKEATDFEFFSCHFVIID